MVTLIFTRILSFCVFYLPIKGAKNVNKKRKKAGFDATVEENALWLGVVYKEYTKEQIKEIINQWCNCT